MSQPECSACTDLREYAPEFVQSGVTSTVAASLKNNTGLNPALTVLHNNCEDLNDVNDCLIGRKMQELESLDVCDWKDFMSGFGPNLYETLKAIIASDCGLWITMCENFTTMLEIIGGGNAKAHYFTPTSEFRTKWSAGAPWSADDVYPIFQAELRRAGGCGAGKQLSVWRVSFGYKTPHPPYGYPVTVSNLAVGDVLGTISKSELVPDLPESMWISLMRGGNQHRFGLISVNTSIRVTVRGYIVVDGVEFNVDLKNTYGPDVMIMEIAGFIGDLRSGGLAGDSDPLHAYVV